jgi:hypothetical protein
MTKLTLLGANGHPGIGACDRARNVSESDPGARHERVQLSELQFLRGGYGYW